MGVKTVLTDEAQKELLRRCWYAHDARWFMRVVDEFGIDTANRLNRLVCRALGEAEMRRFLHALGVPPPATVRQLVEVLNRAMCFFAPPPLTRSEIWQIDGYSYGAWIRRCFIHDNVTKAGIASSYVCAAFDRLQGWHDALSLPLVEDPPALPCAKTLGRECVRIMTIR